MFRCKINSGYECNGCMWCYDIDELTSDEVEEDIEEEDDERDLLD